MPNAMKRFFIQTSLIVFTCVGLVGCESYSGSSSQSDSNSTTDSSAKKTIQYWKLADGTQFGGWVSGNNYEGKRSWIWCDAQTGPVSYRITGGDQSGEWKPMKKIDVQGDDNQIVDDPNGTFGAAEMLPAGKYTISFKVGMEEFSAVTLQVGDKREK
jgi:hypothetical protein